MKVLLTPEEIAARVRALGAEITRDYAETSGLVVVAVLRGAICFCADLIRAIDLPLTVDFLSLHSYEGTTGGTARLAAGLRDDLAGRQVVLVEDILERGTTLRAALDLLAAAGPAHVDVCTLLRKPEALRLHDLPPARYVGFDIGPEFVVGYGLDYDGRFRNLPYVAIPDEDDLRATGFTP